MDANKPMHLELLLASGTMLEGHNAGNPSDSGAPYLFQFLVAEGTVLMDAVKAAAVDYLKTDAGRAKWAGRNDDAAAIFDDKDYVPFAPLAFWEDVPDAVLKAHGLARLAGKAAVPLHRTPADKPVARFRDAWDGYLSGFEQEARAYDDAAACTED